MLRSILFSAVALTLCAQEPNTVAVPVTANSTGPKIYTVKKGDSLSSIAKDRGISYNKILNLNPEIANKELKEGDKVVLEGESTAKPRKRAKKAVPTVAPSPVQPTIQTFSPDPTEPRTASQSHVAGDWVRIAYQANRIYHVRLVRGAPVMVELPLGEVVKTIWVDKTWFLGEAVPGANRFVLKAQSAEGVEGQKTIAHIETRNDLRISLVLECVPMPDRKPMPPGVYTFYLTGQDEEVARRQMISEKASAQAEEYQIATDAKNKAAFAQWQTEAMGKMHSNYKINGPLPVNKVVDNGVQTWIYVTGVSQINSLKLINREKKEEVIDFEFLNGAYTVNRTLKEGERFELAQGKEITKILRKG